MGAPISQLFDLSGRNALVTGGSRGLGLQIAEALGEAGAKVMLTSRKAAELEEAVATLSRPSARHSNRSGNLSAARATWMRRSALSWDMCRRSMQ